MRRWLIGGVAVLVACGLVLFWVLRSRGPAAPGGSSEATLARKGSTRLAPTAGRPEQEGSALPTAQSPSEADGTLDVEVLSGGKPSPGTTVRLYAPGARTSTWTLTGSGLTDPQGHVRLASRPGRYLVAVRAPDRAPLLRDVVRPLGESRTALQISLEPAQSLTGRTVVHGTNEPLPLVEVVLTAHSRELEAWQRADAPDDERVFATSDERGNFRVDGLTPGAYLLEARAPGYARVVLSRLRIPTEGPLTLALRLASVIEGFVVDSKGQPAADAEVRVGDSASQAVTTGAQGGFSVEVEPGAHPLSARRGEESGALDLPVLCVAGSTVRDVRIQLGPGAVLEGRVVEASSGQPVEGARVDVTLSGSDSDPGVAMSDAEGHFLVRGLAPGSYDANVTAPAYSPAIRRGLTVRQGERFPLEFKLSGTGAVEGQVRDRNGAAVAGARVSGVNRWSNGMDGPPIEARTDADGRYRLEGIATGRLSLSARHEGSTVGVIQFVTVEANQTARADFTLDGTGTVNGVVRAARGSLPDGQLEVTALMEPPAEPRRERVTPGTGQAVVDAEGAFRMVLPAGNYILLLSARGRFVQGPTKRVLVEMGRSVPVEFTWEEPRDVSEYRGVVLEPDGSPSPHATITLMPADGQNIPLSMTPTDEEGRFAISATRVGGPPTRRVLLDARNGGRSSEAMPVTADQQVVVRLRPAAFLRGRVVRKGEPVQGFTLSLQLQKGFLPMKGDGTLEFSGDRFELRDVPPEPVKLTARTVDGSVGEALASPGTGAVLEVEIPLTAPATVQGRLVSAATKAPVPDAYIFIEGEPLARDHADKEGRFVLSGVRAGERVLLAMGGPSQGQLRRPLKVKEGEVLDLGDVALEVTPPTP
ncbi:carboxypeptidase-like regulatory domain-containing protein [Corallococcus carmarthensis]|uniref:Carboxypeptidase regulatory-like domain-containing protein n=1 Tax=Corallococcus carmarthensis TaxID=2316728 RepID=A0A3A8L093_9BACT|nr:carboxypeptidase-like regulatory domain-containing protein [Corallococcus carmarthensis]RKH07664.1 carboxypeptidase regulatory-like domain-containing protein [Corallococcus carmarthensis]